MVDARLLAEAVLGLAKAASLAGALPRAADTASGAFAHLPRQGDGPAFAHLPRQGGGPASAHLPRGALGSTPSTATWGEGYRPAIVLPGDPVSPMWRDAYPSNPESTNWPRPAPLPSWPPGPGDARVLPAPISPEWREALQPALLPPADAEPQFTYPTRPAPTSPAELRPEWAGALRSTQPNPAAPVGSVSGDVYGPTNPIRPPASAARPWYLRGATPWLLGAGAVGLPLALWAMNRPRPRRRRHFLDPDDDL
jgi:hypothetical protein